MVEEESQQCEWEEEVGLSEETTYVALYPSRKHAEEWMKEAEEKGYGSRSKYLYELIQEARAARQEGFLTYSQNEPKVKELEMKVEQLQEELEEERDKESGEIDIAHEEFVTTFLNERYQPLDKILHQVTDSGVLTGIVKDAVEDQLFDLAEEGEVEYKQGYGWRLAHDSDEQEVVEV
ncbi:hypothetical protein [Halopiger goleimassiliensis]|uniref:hypothetical protein n=1 Tax=Halopiger goleimassiliensis TaxID=1293048 RepID=UPI000677DB52|nr:hypothetical protein [Halopiger goleimassiliensis]